MEVIIVGAGVTGLTAAYRLSQKGHRVIVFEKEKYPGGLAAGFEKEGWQWPLENFFHHLFTSDKAAKKLMADLDLADKLFYARPKTSIFYQGTAYQFDSPLSLLQFPHLSFQERLRAGLTTASLKYAGRWEKLEEFTAKNWLEKHYGKRPYRILWKPLLESKFSDQASQISMVWFWARIKKRSGRLGYLRGGFQVLTERLMEKIKENGGKIVLNQEIQDLSQFLSQKRKTKPKVIVTTPASVFLKIAPNLPSDYKKRLKKMAMLGAINLILELKEKFLKDNTYWLNINDPGFPFVAVVEHTNFISPQYYGNHHLLYVGGYYPQNHHYFKMEKQAVLREFLPHLKKINPKLKQTSIINSWLSTNLYAQPIVPTNYFRLFPPLETPIPNLYLANMQQIYPWDRGINYAIAMGENVAGIAGQ